MPGLLGEVFSQADRAKRFIGGLLSNPIGSLEQTAGLLSDMRREDQALNAKAFADPRNPLQVTDSGAMQQLGERMLSGPLSIAPVGMILYHGSNSPDAIRQIRDSGTFGGLFASPSKESALSHGKSLYRMTVPENSVMSSASDVEWDKALQTAKSFLPKGTADDVAEELADMALYNRGAWNASLNEDVMLKALRAGDLGEADWALQELRGKMARDAGFKAVHMPDEHGASYLVLPGVMPRPYNIQAR